MSATVTAPAPTRRSLGRAYLLVGLVGILVIPLGLSLAFNSWHAPDAEAYIRMAFATVAGATIALVTSWALLIASVAQQARMVTPVLVVVAALVTSGAISSFTLAADNLARLVGR